MDGLEKSKTTWIIANWKSNKTIEEALEWVGKVGPKISRKENLKVVVCPTFVALEEVKKAIQVGNYPLLVGAQDLSPFEEGAYTGEEAAEELAGIVDLCILGHSERRQNFKETDEAVAQKVKRAKEKDILPLVCVQGKETPVPEDCRMIAYEPISAIGTGNPDTPVDASQVSAHFQEKYKQSLKSGDFGNNLVVLYGGSVTSSNARQFLEVKNLSGLLIGGASLDPEEFVKIVDIVS
jgi:triosephosphate isomerase (TIM)